MQIKDITEEDSKNLIQLHKIIAHAMRELKFSVADAKVIDESSRWFQKFVTMAGQIQKFESQTKEKGEEKTDGIEGLNIKDFHPGDLSVVSGGKKGKVKTKAKSKSKTKSKKRK